MQNVRPELRRTQLAPAPTALSQAVRRSLSPAPSSFPGFAAAGSGALGHQDGFGMMETLLVLTAGALLAGGVYTMYQKTSASRQVAQERENVGAIAENVTRIYSGRNTFAALNNTTAINQGVYPRDMVPTTPGFTGGIKSIWNGSVGVQSATVSSAPGVSDNAFTITYSNVPASACADFVSSSGNGFYEVTVNSACAPGSFCAGSGDIHAGSVLSTNNKNRVDPALASSKCTANSLVNVAFTYLTNPIARSTCAGSGPIPPNTDTQTANCPNPGVTNSLTQLISDPGPDQYNSSWQQTRTQSGSCGANGLITWGPWSAWDPNHNCADQCIPVNTSTTDNRVTSCPAGQLVSTPGAYLYQPSWPQTQTITTTRSCATPIGPLNGNVVNFNPWTPVLTCAAVCTPTSTPESQPAPCPAGQVATTSPYGSTSGTQSRVASQTCATPIGPLNPVAYTPWGAPVGQSCAPVCVPVNTTQTQPAPCPAGQLATTSFALALLDRESIKDAAAARCLP